LCAKNILIKQRSLITKAIKKTTTKNKNNIMREKLIIISYVSDIYRVFSKHGKNSNPMCDLHFEKLGNEVVI